MVAQKRARSRSLTDAGIKRLARPESGQVDYWDATCKGLGVRVTSAGTRTYNLQTRVLVAGRHKDVRIKLGLVGDLSLAEARSEATRLKAIARRGDDPREVRKSERRAKVAESVNTFAKWRDRFLETRSDKLRPATLNEYSRVLRSPDVSALDDMPISAVRRDHVKGVLDRIEFDRGSPVMANRTLAILRAFFNWLVSEHDLESSPCTAIKARAAETKRDRILTDGELRLFWTACGNVGGDFELPFKLMLLLGQREAEVLGMRSPELVTWGDYLGAECGRGQYSDFGKDEPVWILPRERTKGNRQHVVPIPPLAARLIEEARERRAETDAPGSLLFTSLRGAYRAAMQGTEPRPLSGISKAKARIDREMLRLLHEDDTDARGAGDEAVIEGWRLHDLRRTFRSGLARLGVSSDIAKKIVNHKLGGLDEIYDRYLYLPERRSALARWCGTVERIVDGESGDNVVDIRPRETT